MNSLPIIDIQPLIAGNSNQDDVAKAINKACREVGFFYIIGHGVSVELQNRLEKLSKDFFMLEVSKKMEIEMAKGGKAWRGYFPVGNELTSNRPDQKEGLYFGKELNQEHPLVQKNTPLHGPNLFPNEIVGFKETILEYIEAVETLGHTLMKGLSLSLGLDAQYFHNFYTKDPLILFRIFNYPACKNLQTDVLDTWGVGEHTDYGVLTILKQDANGGLQVKSQNKWIEAPPIPNSFVCNIGDMLEKMTKGLYVSTPHRVKNNSTKDRLSFPLFFDPNYFATVNPLPLRLNNTTSSDSERWDNANVHSFNGTYGDYISNKIAKVFPDLFDKI